MAPWRERSAPARGGQAAQPRRPAAHRPPESTEGKGKGKGKGKGDQGKGKDFEEFKQTITLYGGLLELTGFLKDMTDDQSMIRVSNMNIQPATNARKQLKVDLTFVASYPIEPEAEPESKPKKNK